MARIKGITITLISNVETSKDPFGNPVFQDLEISVDNVIVAPVPIADMDVINNLSLDGRKAVYMLGIPKGDTNVWENNEVRFFGERWRAFGIPVQGMEHLMPLDWNKKVMVERYE